MDATRYHGLARLLPLVLVSLGTMAPALWAEESSTLVFTNPHVGEKAAREDAPAPTAEKRSATASLVFVTETKSQPISQPQRLQTASSKPASQPTRTLQSEQSSKPSSSPQPAKQSAAQPIARPVEQTVAPRVEPNQPIRRAAPVAEPEEAADPAAELLVEAHELSLQATESREYDEIIALCQSARRLGLEGESLEFANTLMAWALNRRGQSRADQGNQQLADEDFEQALKLDPSNWRALHNRGVSYAQAGMFAEALDDFNRVIKLNPLYAKAFANRATLFTQSGDLEVALADYQRASRLDPNLLVAQVGVGRTCHLLGRWEEALDAFNCALELKADSPQMVCSRADLLSDMGRYGDALADYAAAIDLDPEFAHAYRNGAWLLATCPDSRYRDGANAIRGAERALEFGYGQRHVALDTLAAAQASAGQFDEAIRTLEDALKIAPHDARVAYRTRLKLYFSGKPFLTDPPADVAQVVYEASDR